ncbi:CobW family GTP-binding protein [Salinirubellus sp. GCM10025818]|uniref:CobW family GTP-binding protein n=1 Tax=Salinirubellus TaxID=2162630 RepID=UPI0030D0DBE3
MTDHPDTATTIPITVLTGPLGAGKTTLVNHLLADPAGHRIAVVVNDMGEVNVDAELLEADDDGIVDLSNGCICCRLQGDLVQQVTRLSRIREFDYLVVEASGISEPLPIARALTGRDEADGRAARYRLDTLVTVVDAYGFWKAFDPEAGLPDTAPDPDRPLTEIMVDQIEFCDVLLLNKCDMVPGEALDTVERAVRELQPRALLHRTTYSEVDPGVVLGTGRFDFEAARRAPGWKRELAGSGEADADRGHDHGSGEASAAERHGVESVVYERDRPFDPDRLDAWLDDWNEGIIRAKGFAWVTSRPGTVLGISQAGPSIRAGPIGEWGGDRPTTRLVFIGRDFDADRLATELDDCLATDVERTADRSPANDPFPREG